MTTASSSSEHKAILYFVPRWILAVLAGLAPTIMTFALVAGYLKRNFFDFRPLLWNDQTYYWHQILTFSHAGFNGGYYMFYEKIPHFNFFHFGASGFLYPALYGAVAHFIGWQMVTGILLNMITLAVACWIVIYVAKFDQVQIVLTGLLLLAVGPVLLYIVTISQESFHQAAALILAAIFYRLLQPKQQLSRRFILASIAFLVVISLVRFSWTLLFLPFFILSLKEWSWRKLAAVFVISGIFVVVILYIFQNTSAPGNNSVFGRVGQFSTAPFAAVQSLWNAVVFNLEKSFVITDIHHLTIDVIEFVQFFIVHLCLILGGRLFVNQESSGGVSSLTTKLLFFHIYNLLSILGASLLFYLSTGYYRVLAPHILLAGVLFIAFKNFRLAAVLIFISFMTVGVFLNEYRKWDSNFTSNSADGLALLKAPYEQALIYDADTTNPWCNTLLTEIQFLDNPLTFIPAGIGVSFFLAPTEQAIPIKSRYLLLDDNAYAVLHERSNLTLLAPVTGGSLYRNLDAECAK